MRGGALMVQGTASSVGKSILVAALCRILRQDGWKVAPFKAQNMSLNSYVTPDGGEIGRAQAVQAAAAGIEPTVDMNPILLKPEADNRSQVVFMGRLLKGLSAKEYYSGREELWPVVTQCLDRLLGEYDVVVMEGAGSPAEMNLKDNDLANMRVALYAEAPVLLVADIDRGGVFASLVGTLELLEPEERKLVGALVINKFRGDLYLLTSGLSWLEERTGIPVAGVVPYFRGIHIPEEDSISLERRRQMKAKDDYLLDIAVIGLPHISNFDDFDPLEREERVRLRYVRAGDFLGRPDLVIVPGTKSTMADLDWLRSVGLANAVMDLAQGGVPVVGICGGYQMLGERLLDPEGVESSQSEALGLGLLPVTTVFAATKETHRVEGEVAAAEGLLEGARGLFFRGYEIHMGRMLGEGLKSPFKISKRSGEACNGPDGVLSPSGRVLGTYVHGLFHNPAFTRALLERVAGWKGVRLSPPGAEMDQDREYDRLAELVRASLDMDLVYRLVGLKRAGP